MLKKFLCLIGFSLLSVSVFAIKIDNPSFKLKLSAGEVSSGTVTVENPKQEEVFVKVYLEDFIYVPPFDGSKEFSAPGTTKFSLSKRIVFSPHEFTLGPYAQQKVNFTVNADKAQKIVQCSVLFFETTLGSSSNEQGEKIDVVGRIGSLIFVEKEDNKRQGVFKDIKGLPYKLKGTFVNSGETFLNVKGTFYVMDREGMVEDRGEVNELYLLPVDEAETVIELSKQLAPSKEYTAIVTFDLGEEEPLVKEVDFYFSTAGEVKILAVRD